MRYHVLASDYDGTLAHDGTVTGETLTLLEKLLSSGRKLILVTGRELEELRGVFPEIKLFHRVVAENGALLYDPASGSEKPLTAAVPSTLADALRERGVAQLSVGRVIVSTLRPEEGAVLAAISDLGLELQTIFNRDSVMVLPPGVNKATGLAAALESLGLSAHEVAGIGDAENDHAFLDLSEFSVAVNNALPALKERADWVTDGADGDGVGELIEELIADDLEARETGQTRRSLLLGNRADGSEVRLSPRGPNILIAGPSGSGKSTIAHSFLERLIEGQYQFCIIDPEGDYEGLAATVTLGRGGRGPMAEEVLEVLAQPGHNVVVNLLGLPVAERPAFFLELLPRLQEMRTHTNRPHWLILDETHHLLPASWEPAQMASLDALQRTLFITVHPDQVVPPALKSVGIVLAVGKDPQDTFALFGKPLQIPPPSMGPNEFGADSAVLWPVLQGGDAYPVKIAPSQIEHQRHVRKYAVGELPPDRSFYFRGPEKKFNLRAQNLQTFVQMAEGMDEEIWMHHLSQGDYSRWFRIDIKDDQLATETEAIEQQSDLSADESRSRVCELINRYYSPSPTSPALTPVSETGRQAATTVGQLPSA